MRLEEILGGLAHQVTVNFDEHSGTPSVSFGIGRRIASDEEKRRALESVVERMDAVRTNSERPVAVDALVARGLLTRVDDSIRFDSPFVRRWVRQEIADDIG